MITIQFELGFWGTVFLGCFMVYSIVKLLIHFKLGAKT